VQARRAVNWSVIQDEDAPAPVPVPHSARGELAGLLSAFDWFAEDEDDDSLIRRAIELARTCIGLERVGVFLCEQGGARMLGTWGTDLDGGLVDEHHIMFDATPAVADVFVRAESLGEPFTALDNCPIVVHGADSTRVVGRGWLV
jgi:hypothetical protein